MRRIARTIRAAALVAAAVASAAPAWADDAKQPPLTFSAWTKVCVQTDQTRGQLTCATHKEGRFESGQPILAATLIEIGGSPKKTLRIRIPLGMVLQYGTRLLIDQGQPAAAPYVNCSANGCISDYEASAEVISKLKKGQTLHAQAVSASSGQGFTLSMPLGDFAKVYEGSATSSKAVEEEVKTILAGPTLTSPRSDSLIFSPWTKFCMKADAKQVCVTGKEGKTESGQPILSAVLIEPEGEAKKILRLIVPLGVVLQYGTRLLIDQGQPATAPYVVCYVNGCMSDHEANAEVVGNMKKRQALHVQAVSTSSGQAFNLSMPLGGFAKAYDGPPTDPKVFEEQQKKLQAELQRREEEARKKAQPPAQISSVPATPTTTTAPAASISQDTGRRVALVIGNGAYRHATTLPNPGNDAADIAQALRELNFEVIEGRDLDWAGIRAKVKEFDAKLDNASLALFFYAGHGVQVDGRNYLVPVDAKLDRAGTLDQDAFDLLSVLRPMEAEQRINLVFLDACRDNPFTRSLARSLGASRSSAVGMGLAPIQKASGTLITYATEPGNVAADGEGRNSPFTAALLKHIRKPGIEIEQMMKLVRMDVLAATRQKQLPKTDSGLPVEVFLRRAAQ